MSPSSLEGGPVSALRCAVAGLTLLFAGLGFASGVAGESLRRDDGRVPAQQVQVDPAYWETAIAIPGDTRTIGEAERAATREAELNAIRTAPDRVSVMVTLQPVLGPQAVARQKVRDFAQNIGAKVQYEYKVALPNVLNLRDVPMAEVEKLRTLPGVQSVEPDEYHDNVLLLHDSTALVRGLQSQISGAGISEDGAGVRICVVDTGIDSDHVMYAGRIDTAAGWDFHNGDNNPEDDNGHGSHVSGIALGGVGLSVDFGCGAGSEPFQGMAPGATLIGVKVLNSGGGGFTSNIVAGIDHCADQSPAGGRADVINMSIGTGNYTGPCTHAWAVAANNAAASGVVPVAASGNENNANSMGSPACGADVIAVGATWKADYPTCEDNVTNWNWGVCTDFGPNTDDVGCFSNESDFLDVTAPGLNIWSASNAAGGGSIVGQSGTSMASPAVAGLAALILGQDGSLTPAEVRQIIRDGAVDMGPAGFDRAYGWGRIDVINSLQLVGGGCTTDPECNDGQYCNGAETCVAGSCQPGAAPDCDDGVGCTADACNEATDSCDHTANDTNCDDGLFCNGAETCHAILDCQAGSDPCGGQTCNETTDTCGAGDTRELWVSFQNNANVPGVGTIANEDVVVYSYATGTWALVFDGSDLGLASLSIGALSVLDNGDMLMSFVAAGTVPGLIGGPSGTSVDDSDIVRFVPTTLGPATSGTFYFHFDGSDVGMTTNSEDIDAIAVHADGRLILSTRGSVSATGASGADEDLMIFTASNLGATTSGSFAMFFDGSDVGLSTTSSEDIDSARYTVDGTILLSTVGVFSVSGASGDDEDLFEFFPTTTGSNTSGTFAPYASLTSLGISSSEDVNAISVVWR